MDITKHIIVEVSDDGMEARLCLSTAKQPDETEEYTDFSGPIIMEILKSSGVTFGIDGKIISIMLRDKMYNQFVTVAKGSPITNGTNGTYTFHFHTEIDRRPKILPDGSIDYHSVDIYEPVSYGQEIVTYTPATRGVNGMTVGGETVNAVPGKDLPKLKGTGFQVSEDGNHYISSMNGKIEYFMGTITISNLLDINGDVDLTTGDIEFDGDVIVHGSVMMGSTIHAGGNLNISGNVEGAELVAGGDIQLKNGMQGGGKGTLICGGTCWGKFFEQTTIKVHGDFFANSVLNCNVYCDGTVNVTGKHGLVVGGSVLSQGNIVVTSAGNLAEVRTSLSAGANEELLAKLSAIEETIKDVQEQIKKTLQVKDKLDAIKSPTDPAKYEMLVKQVSDSLEALDNQYHVHMQEKDELLKILSASSFSKIVINKYLYPNVSLSVNGLNTRSKDTWINVAVKDTGGKVEIVNNV